MFKLCVATMLLSCAACYGGAQEAPPTGSTSSGAGTASSSTTGGQAGTSSGGANVCSSTSCGEGLYCINDVCVFDAGAPIVAACAVPDTSGMVETDLWGTVSCFGNTDPSVTPASCTIWFESPDGGHLFEPSVWPPGSPDLDGTLPATAYGYLVADLPRWSYQVEVDCSDAAGSTVTHFPNVIPGLDGPFLNLDTVLCPETVAQLAQAGVSQTPGELLVLGQMLSCDGASGLTTYVGLSDIAPSSVFYSDPGGFFQGTIGTNPTAGSLFVVPNVPAAPFNWTIVTGDATVLSMGTFTPPSTPSGTTVAVSLSTPFVSVQSSY